MKLLLDTHAFIWWATDDTRLSEQATNAIMSPGNELYLSAASVWEMAIKSALGRMQIAMSLRDFLTTYKAQYELEDLPILRQHAAAVANLPPHHRDPFDRMLIAQAQLEEMLVLTADSAFTAYDVARLW